MFYQQFINLVHELPYHIHEIFMNSSQEKQHSVLVIYRKRCQVQISPKHGWALQCPVVELSILLRQCNEEMAETNFSHSPIDITLLYQCPPLHKQILETPTGLAVTDACHFCDSKNSFYLK